MRTDSEKEINYFILFGGQYAVKNSLFFLQCLSDGTISLKIVKGENFLPSLPLHCVLDTKHLFHYSIGLRYRDSNLVQLIHYSRHFACSVAC